MSSAFDTIKRSKLLEILCKFLDEDEMRIIRILLSNTTLELKMKDTETKMLKSNIGSPQGDGLNVQTILVSCFEWFSSMECISLHHINLHFLSNLADKCSTFSLIVYVEKFVNYHQNNLSAIMAKF